jgi:hypothetical protein
MSGPCTRPECGGAHHTDPWGTPVQCPHTEPAPDVACAVVHTDTQGNVIHCPDEQREPESSQADEGRPQPPSEDELNDALPVRPDPRQPAYDAVYEYLRRLGPYLPRDTVHRNAIIWRAVHAALDATPVGRCISSHCVEDDHMVVSKEAP